MAELLAFSPVALGIVIYLLLWWYRERQWKAYLRASMSSYPWNTPLASSLPEWQEQQEPPPPTRAR